MYEERGNPECRRVRTIHGECPAGKAVITTAGMLPAKSVIHTVGPVWRGGGNREAELLRSCYLNSLEIAEQHGLRTIAFPNISTGAYGYPRREAAGIAVDTVSNYRSRALEKVTFVCFDRENYDIYQGLLDTS